MAILDVDAKRAAALSVPNALMLLVAPPSPEALGQLVRATAGPKDKEADIVARITAASTELARCQVSGRCLEGAGNVIEAAWTGTLQCTKAQVNPQSRGCKCST